MKKFAKLFGLLLVAGAMFVGCQQNVDIDTNEIKLSNGKWESNTTVTSSADVYLTGTHYKSSGTTKSKDVFKVTDDVIEFLSGSESGSGKVEFDEGTSALALASAKLMIAANLPEGVELTLDGTTYSYTYSHTDTEDELKVQNAAKPKVSTMSSTLPKVARIQTNKKKTEYKVSYEQETTDSTDPDHPSTMKTTYLMTIKKL